MTKALLLPSRKLALSGRKASSSDCLRPRCCGTVPSSCCFDLDRYSCGEQRSVCCHLGSSFRVRVLSNATYKFIQTEAARGYDPTTYYICPPPAFGPRESSLRRADFEATVSCVEVNGAPRWDVEVQGSIYDRLEFYEFDDLLQNRGLWHSNAGHLQVRVDETNPVTPEQFRSLWLFSTFLDPHHSLSRLRAQTLYGISWPFPSELDDRSQRLVCSGDVPFPYISPEAPFSSAPGRACGGTLPGTYHWQGNADCSFANFTETYDQDVATCYPIPPDGQANWVYGRVEYRGYAEVLVDRVVPCESPCGSTQLGRCDTPDGCVTDTLGGCSQRGGIWTRGSGCAGLATALEILGRFT